MSAAAEVPPPHILIVEARFYADIADEMLKGAVRTLEGVGASYERLSVPGAFEIPAAVLFSSLSPTVAPPWEPAPTWPGP